MTRSDTFVRGVPVTLGAERSLGFAVDGFLVTDITFPSGTRIPFHDHDRATFAVCLAGGMDVHLPGRTLDCPSSAVVTEPAGQQHGNRMGAKGCRVVAIQPDPRRADRVEAFGGLLGRVSHLRHPGVVSLGWRVASEIASADAVTPFAIEGLALEMLALASRLGFGGPALRRPPVWLGKVRDLLHDGFRESPRTDDLAREAGVHPVHLARVFRTHLGVPIGEYLRRLRIEWAMSRLAGSDDPLSQIALDAGFADQSHFTRLFRRHTGSTPDQFRRLHRR